MHHNFVVAFLNDRFGIQARGRCACMGTYGHGLLGIDDKLSRSLIEGIAKGWNGIRPGWVRVMSTYFLMDEAAYTIICVVQDPCFPHVVRLDHTLRRYLDLCRCDTPPEPPSLH